MWRSTRAFLRDRRAFTLAEVLVTTFVVLYVIAAAWSIYVMVWRWWYETAPVIEAQRVARMTLGRVVQGIRDTSLGSDTIQPSTYYRRNGIAGTMLTNANPTPLAPVITTPSQGQNRIDFRLEPDTSNVRSFYIGTPSAGTNALYYGNVQIPATRIAGTIYLTCANLGNNLYKVTVRVEKTVSGTRRTGYPVVIEYSDHIFLRNI